MENPPSSPDSASSSAETPSSPPSEHDKILSLLTEIAADQKVIVAQNKKLLRIERNKRIWGIVKWIVILVIVILPLLLLPLILNSLMGNMTEMISGGGGGVVDFSEGLNQLMGNPEALQDIEKYLSQ